MRAGRVAIVGVGLVSPRGIGPLGRVVLREEVPLALQGYAVQGFEAERWLPSTKTYLDPASAYTLAAVRMALEEAGWEKGEAFSETGIVLGTGFGCLASWQRYWERVVQGGNRAAHSLLFSHAYANTPASLAAIEFGLGGYHSTVTAGRLSSLQALAQAGLALEEGHARRMVAVGVEALAEPWLRGLRRYWQRCRPAEGAAAFALEQVPEGSPCWARLEGWAFAFGPKALERAVKGVLERAGCPMEQVDGLLTRRCGLEEWDNAEEALERRWPAQALRYAPALEGGEAFGAGDALHLAYLLARAEPGQRWLLTSWDDMAGAGALLLRCEGKRPP